MYIIIIHFRKEIEKEKMITFSFKSGIVVLGIITMAFWFWNTILVIYKLTQSVSCSTKRYGKDSWAIVTGCTDRIGIATVKELANRGFNIVLIGKSAATLKAVEV